MKVEVDVLDCPSLIVLMVSVNVTVPQLRSCAESRGGRPGLTVLKVSVDVKQH